MKPGMEKLGDMGIGDAFLTSILGFAIVFFVLVVLMFVISFLRAWVEKMESAKAAPAPAGPAPAPAAAPAAAANMVPAKGSLGEIKLHNVDDKTAAMLMAIVANELKAPLNELRFTSIREKK